MPEHLGNMVIVVTDGKLRSMAFPRHVRSSSVSWPRSSLWKRSLACYNKMNHQTVCAVARIKGRASGAPDLIKDQDAAPCGLRIHSIVALTLRHDRRIYSLNVLALYRSVGEAGSCLLPISPGVTIERATSDHLLALQQNPPVWEKRVASVMYGETEQGR